MAPRGRGPGRKLAAARLISAVGTCAADIAIAYALYQRTHSACGIGAFVEVAIPAVMYGTTKPRPEAFMLCCDALKLDSVDCWFVGDRLIDDVTASADLGMQSVLVDREGRYSNDPPTFPRLPDLSHLPTLIRSTAGM